MSYRGMRLVHVLVALDDDGQIVGVVVPTIAELNASNRRWVSAVSAGRGDEYGFHVSLFARYHDDAPLRETKTEQ